MQLLRGMSALWAGLALHTAAHAQARAEPAESIDAYIERIVRLRDEVASLAFDPKTLFGDQPRASDFITIAYVGDEFGSPVYSMAIRQGCLDGEKTGRHCASRRTVRMVRAPAPPDLSRPRERGSHLIRHLLRSEGPLRSALDRAGLEWLEAELNDCPAAAEKFQNAGSLTWVPPELYAPHSGGMRGIVLHADQVEVTFEEPARRSTYSGYVAEGSPAEWAVQFAEALEGCWRPATAPAPWRR